MPWLWTDDLAELLIEHAGIQPEAMAEWTQRPVALSVPEGMTALDYAQTRLGIDKIQLPGEQPKNGGP